MTTQEANKIITDLLKLKTLTQIKLAIGETEDSCIESKESIYEFDTRKSRKCIWVWHKTASFLEWENSIEGGEYDPDAVIVLTNDELVVNRV